MKTKANLREGPDNIIVIQELCFLLVDGLSIGEREEGVSFEIGRPGSKG